MALIDKLTAIADAIRGKTGKTEEMTLDQMPTEIAGIETGGGEEVIDLICQTITKIDSDIPTIIRDYMFYECKELKTINLPNVMSIGQRAFYGYKELETVNLPNVTTIYNEAFRGCSLKKELVIENLTKLSYGSFSGVNMPKARFPKLETIEGQCFRYSGQVGIFDLPVCTTINVANFEYPDRNYCEHLILRTDSVCVLSTLNTGIKNVYVPSELIEEYKVATNWVDLYTTNPDIFHALEEYTVDGTTTGELDESKFGGE